MPRYWSVATVSLKKMGPSILLDKTTRIPIFGDAEVFPQNCEDTYYSYSVIMSIQISTLIQKKVTSGKFTLYADQINDNTVFVDYNQVHVTFELLKLCKDA